VLERVWKRLQFAWLSALAAAFVAFPFVWWYRLLTGRFDMSAPMEDVSSDTGPGVRQGLRYGALTLWTAASLVVLFFLLRGCFRNLRQRLARRRGDFLTGLESDAR
jgi:hypothetical protein